MKRLLFQQVAATHSNRQSACNVQKSLSARVLILSIGSALQKGSALLTMVFLVRLLSPEMYGTYQQVLYAGGISYGLFASGLAASIYYFLPKLGESARSGFMIQTIIVVAVLGAVSGLLVFVFAPQLALYFKNPPLESALTYYAAYIALWIGMDYFVPFLNASGRHVSTIVFGVFDALTNAVFLLMPLWLGLSLHESLGILAIAAGLRYVLYLTVTLRLTRTTVSEVPPGMLGEQFRYSIPLVVSGWTDLLGGYLNVIVVSLLYSPSIVAIYAVGTIPIPIWDMVAKPVNIVLRVKFAELLSKDRASEIQPIWWEAVRKQSMIVVPVIFFIWVSADHIIRFLFTDVYEDSVWILRIALLDKLLFVMSFSVFPLSMGRSDVLMKGSVVYAISNASLLYLLSTPLGYFGPITAGVVAMYLTISYYVYVTVRYLHIPLAVLIPAKTLLRVFSANAIAAAAAYGVGLFIAWHLLAILVSGIVYVLICAALLWQFGLLQAKDIELIKRFLPLRILRRS